MRKDEFCVGHLTSIQSAEIFLQRFPVVSIPADRQVLAGARGKAGVIEDELCSGALYFQFETSDRKDSGVPTDLAPCLYDAFAWHEFELPADDGVGGALLVLLQICLHHIIAKTVSRCRR